MSLVWRWEHLFIFFPLNSCLFEGEGVVSQIFTVIIAIDSVETLDN